MRINKKERRSKAIQIALTFCGFVIALVLLALIGKFAILLTQSHFDGSHQFVVQVKQQNHQSDVVIFQPDKNAIAIITLSGKNADNPAIQTIQVPVDAVVNNSTSNVSENGYVSHLLLSSLFHDGSTLTTLDAIRLLLFSQSVGTPTMASLQLPSDMNTIDSVVTPLATDQTMYKQGYSIAIINSSGVSGVGNTVAKLLTHIGGNVISITTAATDSTNSKIVFSGNMTYTVSRLSEILAIPSSQRANASIADVTIIIGEDKGNSLEQNL